MMRFYQLCSRLVTTAAEISRMGLGGTGTRMGLELGWNWDQDGTRVEPGWNWDQDGTRMELGLGWSWD